MPDNTRGPVNFEANAAARYYDVTLSNPGTITLDMNPQIDSLSIAGAQSELVIPAPYMLEVLLSTKLFDGTPFESVKYRERRDDVGRLMLSVLMRARNRLARP